MRRGDVCYHASVQRSGRDEDGACRVQIEQYVVRSIRKGVVFATRKTDLTWVRHGVGRAATWGWARSIPAYYRHSFRQEDQRSALARSESGAVRSAIQQRVRIRPYWMREDVTSVQGIDDEVACLKRWLARRQPPPKRITP